MPPAALPPTVVTFIQNVTSEIINPLIAVIFAAALVYFLWGLALFVTSAGDSAKRTQYKSHMLWGVIGMVVMVSVYAILAIGLRTFGITSADLPADLPSSLTL
jgi:succinate dehydrogenase/fumarate reductase cytochrome b subunit